MTDFFEVTCPHCHGTVIIQKNEVNCRIFRHGVYKVNNEPVPPHAPKVECDRLVEQSLIFGCGRPFQVQDSTDASGNLIVVAIQCDYI